MQYIGNDSVFENESLIFNADNNTLSFKHISIIISLTELQGRLIFLLLKGETNKNNIIKNVWQHNHISIADNNYHQLIYQCRALFSRHGISPNVIKTLPRIGITFNYSALPKQPDKDDEPATADTQQANGHQALARQKWLGVINNKRLWCDLVAITLSTLALVVLLG